MQGASRHPGQSRNFPDMEALFRPKQKQGQNLPTISTKQHFDQLGV